MIVAVFGDMRVGPCVRESVTKVWSGRRESNPRHTAWEAVVLPLNYARASISIAKPGRDQQGARRAGANDQSRPNCLRSSPLARCNVLRLLAGKFLPARLM